MSTTFGDLTQSPNPSNCVFSHNDELTGGVECSFYSQTPSGMIPLPSIHTFQGLQQLVTSKQQFVSSDCPTTPSIKTETDVAGCLYLSHMENSDIIGKSVTIKSEPLSPTRNSLSSCTSSSSVQHKLRRLPKEESIINTTCAIGSNLESVKSLKRMSTALKTPKKLPRSSSSIRRSVIGDDSHSLPDSTTNVAELMNSLQMWMNRWNESSLPGAPQISITITPRSDASPRGEESSPSVVDAEHVIRQEVEQGHLFECTHCRLLFRERGLYFLHASLHDSLVPFKCSVCGRTCKDRNDFQLHFINQPHHD